MFAQRQKDAKRFLNGLIIVLPIFVIIYLNVKVAIQLCSKETCKPKIIRFENLIELKHIRKINWTKLKKRDEDVVVHISMGYIDSFEFKPRYDGIKYQHSYLNKNVSETRVTKTFLLYSMICLLLNTPTPSCCRIIAVYTGIDKMYGEYTRRHPRLPMF